MVFLSLGSNLGDTYGNLIQAIKLLIKYNIVLIESSSFYSSHAQGYQSENEYLNAVLKIETNLPSSELLKLTQLIEKEMGRENKTIDKMYQDRIIDIDILWYHGEVINSRYLQIPHPQMHKRNFVLAPLFELKFNALHPVLKLDFHSLYKEICDESPLFVVYSKEIVNEIFR